MNSIEYWQERCQMAEDLAETLKEAAACNAEEARNAERACTLLLGASRIVLRRMCAGEAGGAHQLQQAIERAEELLGVKYQEKSNLSFIPFHEPTNN